MVSDDITYEKAVKAYNDATNTYTLVEIAEQFGVQTSTLQRRVHGGRTMSEYHQSCQLLTPAQEQILETYVIYLQENLKSPTRNTVRQLAGYMLGTPNKIPGYAWFDGFISRSKLLSLSESGKIDFPRIRENREFLIKNFFNLYRYYIEKFNVDFEDVWNLDEAGFQIGETPKRSIVVSSQETPSSTRSGQSTESVRVLELISAKGKVSSPLFICKGKYLMEKWLPGRTKRHFSISTNKNSNFITSDIFFRWLEFCPELRRDPNGKYKILLIDGHSSHRNVELIEFAIERRILLLYYPSHLTHILQPLDHIACFGAAKQTFRNEMEHAFMKGHSPSKILFFDTYFEVRRVSYSDRTIACGFRKAGLHPINEHLAATTYLKFAANKERNESSTTTVASDSSDCEDEIFHENLTWRSINRSLQNYKVHKNVINGYKKLFHDVRKLKSEIEILKQERDRLLVSIYE